MNRMPKAIVLIPARLASTRLPGKPLAEIAGEAMIVHVWRRAVAAGVGPVAVAAADPPIVEAVRRAGGEAVATRPDHVSGSDRIFEALLRLDPEGRYDVVVNVQGDLPTLDPALIRAALEPLEDAQVDIATLVAPLGPGERRDPNVVKALVPRLDKHGHGRAAAFARTLPPGETTPAYHHIGLYAYRRAALERFVNLPASENERRHKLEQLRALEAGMRIDVARVDTIPLGVDTPADLARARTLLAPAVQDGRTVQ